MLLRIRPVRLSDLRYCKEAIRDRKFFTDGEIELMVKLWQNLLAANACSSVVLENPTVPENRQMVWCSIAVFLSGEFAREIVASPEPFVAKKVLSAVNRRGRASVLLNADEIRRANSAEGLHMLLLNSGAPSFAHSEPIWSNVRSRLLDLRLYHCQGYRLRELLIESYDDMASQWMSNIGFKLRKSYALKPFSMEDSSVCTPMLYGCTYNEAMAQPCSVIESMMNYREPVMNLTMREQNLLLYALFGDTDEELAVLLNCSKATIRKRWLAIYDKVPEHPRALELLPSFVTVRSPSIGDPKSDHDAFKRGTEKKRLLLRYMRQHIEELRPATNPVEPWECQRTPKSNSARTR